MVAFGLNKLEVGRAGLVGQAGNSQAGKQNQQHQGAHHFPGAMVTLAVVGARASTVTL